MIKLLSRKPTALRLVNPSAAKIKIFTARSEERFSRNAETDLVCRLLLEKKNYYGGHRPGDGLYGESLVCIEATTGKKVWHYQLVHHGLWDYDLPAAPNLIDITVDGKRIKAVAQPTKQAFLYVFDRVTGKPVW